MKPDCRAFRSVYLINMLEFKLIEQAILSYILIGSIYGDFATLLRE